VATVALAGCGGQLSALAPTGPAAAEIARLWWAMLAGSAVLFGLVMFVFVLVIRRPGWGSNLSPERWITLGGLVLPALVLVPLVTYGMMVGERLVPRPTGFTEHIAAAGRQWVWTFRYPDHGNLETTGVLYLPAHTPVDVALTSSDVIHGFWIPRLAGKIDAVPGHVNHLRIEADKPGRYEAQCSEFCGLGHTTMRFVVIVDTPEKFPAALAQAAAKQGG